MQLPLLRSTACVQYAPHHSASHNTWLEPTTSAMLQDIGRLRLQKSSGLSTYLSSSQASTEPPNLQDHGSVLAQPWPSNSALLSAVKTSPRHKIGLAPPSLGSTAKYAGSMSCWGRLYECQVLTSVSRSSEPAPARRWPPFTWGWSGYGAGVAHRGRAHAWRAPAAPAQSPSPAASCLLLSAPPPVEMRQPSQPFPNPKNP